MKILHTADWHLGQQFYDRNRLDEQGRFLDFVLEVIAAEKVDLLLLAGDVFDTANPPRAAERLYYDFVTRLHQLGHCETVVVGGNHDSAPHLNAPRQVLSHLKVHVVGSLPEKLSEMVFRFEREGKKLCVAAVPFLRDRDVRRAVEGEAFESMENRTKAGVVEVYRQVAELIEAAKTGDEVVLATGHLTAVGGQLSDSERSIHIGHLGSISAAQLSPVFDYVALGHLHRPQAVGESKNIRYSGSPIPLSFSESMQKQMRLLTIDEQHQLSHRSVPIPLARQLLRIKGSADEVEKAIGQLKWDASELCPWIEVTLTEGDASPVINDQIRQTAAEHGAEVLKVGREIRLDQLGNLDAESSKPISEWQPLAVFEKRIENYEGDIKTEILIECFQQALHSVYEGKESEV